MYPAALDFGLTGECYWNMSVGEVQDYLESQGRQEKRRMKRELSEKHFLARDIAQYVGALLAGSKSHPLLELWDFFPDLFEEEKDHLQHRNGNQELAVYKAQMSDFAYRHNRSRKGGGKS